MEEWIQYGLEGWFKNIALGTNYRVDMLSDDALYEGFIGAITASFMEGPGIVADTAGAYVQGRQLLNAGVTGAQLAEIGKTMRVDIQQLTSRLNENSSAYAIGNAFREIGAVLSEENVNRLVKGLQTRGLTRKDATVLANTINSIAMGRALSEQQIEILNANEGISKVFVEMMRNPEAYTDVAEVMDRTKAFNQITAASKAKQTNQANTSQTPAAFDMPNTDAVSVANLELLAQEDVSGVDNLTAQEMDILKAYQNQLAHLQSLEQQRHVLLQQKETLNAALSHGSVDHNALSQNASQLSNVEGQIAQPTKQNNTGKSASKKQYSLRDLEINRIFIQYGDTVAEKSAIDFSTANLVEKGQIVQVSASDVEAHKDNITNDKKATRAYIRKLLRKFMGSSVFFEHNYQPAEAYLTSIGIDHSVGGVITAERAAIFDKFEKLVQNAQYSFSSKNDLHSTMNKRVGGKINWDTFVAVASIDNNLYSVVFRIRTIDADVRSQIYEMSAKKETDGSRDPGQQHDQPHGMSSYGVVPSISEKNVAQPPAEVKKKEGGSLPFAATRNETGSSHNGGQFKNQPNTLLNYGELPVSNGTALQPGAVIKNESQQNSEARAVLDELSQLERSVLSTYLSQLAHLQSLEQQRHVLLQQKETLNAALSNGTIDRNALRQNAAQLSNVEGQIAQAEANLRQAMGTKTLSALMEKLGTTMSKQTIFEAGEHINTSPKQAADRATLHFFGIADANGLQKIIKRGTIPLAQGFSCFPDGDILNQYIKQVSPKGNWFDVAMHGSPTAVGFGSTQCNMSARMLADVIRHNANYSGQGIRLLSCSTGKMSDNGLCFAEELANALGVPVWAPNGTLYITPQGKMYIGDYGDGEFVEFIPNQRRRIK